MKDSIYRIQWTIKDTGVLHISGHGNASNYSEATEPEFVDALNWMFPDITFQLQGWSRELNTWMNA